MSPARIRVIGLALMLVVTAPPATGTCRADDVIRRILASPEQIPRILQNQPELLTIPLETFDKTWSAAVRQGQSSASPSILRARWKARLEGNRLLGEGDILWPGVSRPTSVRFDGWGAALREAPTLKPATPWLSESPPGRPRVWLREPTPQSLALAWSVGGEERPEGIYFDVKLPVSATGTLEITLPQGSELSLPGDPALSATVLASAAGMERTWLIPLGSEASSPLRLLVRRPVATREPSPGTCELAAEYFLNPSAATLTCTWNVDWTSDPPQELRVPLAATLHVSQVRQRIRGEAVPLSFRQGREGDREFLYVTLPQRRERRSQIEVQARWPLATPNSPLSPLGRGATIPPLSPLGRGTSIPPLSPLGRGAGGEGSSPATAASVRAISLVLPAPEETTVRRELVVVRAHSALRFTPLATNGFRFQPPDAEPKRPSTDQERSWSFIRDGLARGIDAGPLHGQLESALGRVTARQQAHWLVGTNRSALRLQAMLRALDGPVFGVDYELPKGFQLESLSTVPAEAIRDWRLTPQPDGQVLHVDFRTPLLPGTPVSLEAHLRGPGWSSGPALPQARVSGAEAASFMLALHVEESASPRGVAVRELMGTQLDPSQAPASPLWSGTSDLWLTARDRPPTGILDVRTLPARRPLVETNLRDNASREHVDPRHSLTGDLPDTFTPVDTKAPIHLTILGQVDARGVVRVRQEATISCPAASIGFVTLPSGSHDPCANLNGATCTIAASDFGTEATLVLMPGRNHLVAEWEERTSGTSRWRTLNVGRPQWSFSVEYVAIEHTWKLPADLVPLWPFCDHDPTSSSWKVIKRSASSEPTRIVLVPWWTLHLFGLGLALGAGLPAFYLAGLRRVLPLVVVAGATLVAVVLPASHYPLIFWPALGGVAALLVPRTTAQSTYPGAVRPKALATAALVLSLLGIASVSEAGEELANVVYVVAGKGDAKPVVLVPPVLWQQLQARAQPPASDWPAAVLLGGKFQVHVRDDTVLVEAALRVQTTRGEPTMVSLPPVPGRLREVSLDSAPAVVASGQQANELAVMVQTEGLHEIRLTWETALQRQGSRLAAVLNLPPFTYREVEFRLPANAHLLSVDGMGGGHVVEATDRGAVVKGFLQRTDQPTVTWHEGPMPPTIAQAQAYYLWELAPDQAELRVVVNASVRQGALNVIEFTLPDELAIVHVEVQGERRSVLRDWEIKPAAAGRTLRLHLATPVTGSLRARLDCLLVSNPDKRTGDALSLPLPRLVGMGATELICGLKKRLIATSAVDPGPGWLAIPRSTDKVRSWPAELGSLPSLDELWQGRSAAAGPLQVRLDVTDKAAEVAHVEITVTGQLPDVAMDGVLRLAPAPGLASEFHCRLPPGCVLTDVRGADLWQWRQTSGTLRACFKKPVSATTLHLQGRLQSSLGRDGMLEADWPYFEANGNVTQSVALAPLPGWMWEGIDETGRARIVGADKVRTDDAELVRLRLLPQERPVEVHEVWQVASTAAGGRFQGRLEVTYWPHDQGLIEFTLRALNSTKVDQVDAPGLSSIERQVEPDGGVRYRLRWPGGYRPRAPIYLAGTIESTRGKPELPTVRWAMPVLRTVATEVNAATADSQSNTVSVRGMRTDLHVEGAGHVRQETTWLLDLAIARSLAISIADGSRVDEVSWNDERLPWEQRAGRITVYLAPGQPGALRLVTFHPLGKGLSSTSWPGLVGAGSHVGQWRLHANERFTLRVERESSVDPRARRQWLEAFQADSEMMIYEGGGDAASTTSAPARPVIEGFVTMPNGFVEVVCRDRDESRSTTAILGALLACAFLFAGGIRSSSALQSGVCWAAGGLVFLLLTGMLPHACVLLLLGARALTRQMAE